MGSARILYVDAPVPPGASVDLSVEMIAPQRNGSYQSNWKMRDAEGVLFGLGPQGDAPFWARITVFDGSTPTINAAPTQTPLRSFTSRARWHSLRLLHWMSTAAVWIWGTTMMFPGV